jgi:hypothetical protein
MEKRYQVFISSTFMDLKNARQEVSQALLRADCFPAGMELFPAADEEQFEFIKTIIDQSDYYILISAGRYGSIHPETGLSYTEMEYDYAVATGQPVIRLLHNDPFNELLGKHLEQSDDGRSKLHAFRSKIKSGKMVAFWNSDQELGLRVREGLEAAIKLSPRTGWIRADVEASNNQKQNPSPPTINLEPLKNHSVKLRYCYYDPNSFHFLLDEDDDSDEAFVESTDTVILSGSDFSKFLLWAFLHSSEFGEAITVATDKTRQQGRSRLAPSKLSQVRTILEHLEIQGALVSIDSSVSNISIFEAARKRRASLDQRYVYGSRWKLTEAGRKFAVAHSSFASSLL